MTRRDATGAAIKLTRDPKWSDPALLILGSLADGPKRGLTILQDVEATLGLKIGERNVYATLIRLTDRGLIEGVRGNLTRRYPFRLTERGDEYLRQQIIEMLGFVIEYTRRAASA